MIQMRPKTLYGWKRIFISGFLIMHKCLCENPGDQVSICMYNCTRCTTVPNKMRLILNPEMDTE